VSSNEKHPMPASQPVQWQNSNLAGYNNPAGKQVLCATDLSYCEQTCLFHFNLLLRVHQFREYSNKKQIVS